MSKSPSLDLLDQVKNVADRVAALEKKNTDDTVVNDDGSSVAISDNYTFFEVQVYTQSTAPTGLNSSTDVGSIWYNTANNDQANWWDGFGWQLYDASSPIYRGGTGLDALASAVTSRSQVSLAIYNAATAPTGVAVNTIWKNTGDASISRWDGSAWEAITDTNITSAVNNALSDPDTDISDSPAIVVYYQDAAPGGLNNTTDKGDLWYDTNDTLREYKWDGSTWVDVVAASQVTPTTDGHPPGYSPAPTLIAGFGTIFVTYDAVSNADTVAYDVYVSTVTPVVADSTTFVGTVFSTFFAIRQDAAGNALAPNTTYYVAIIARDPDGLAPMSSEASTQIIDKITQTQITDGSISTPQLAANAVTADILAANSVYAAAIQTDAVTANAISATAIDGMTITGATVQTGAGNVSVVRLNSSGLYAYDSGGNAVLTVANGAVSIIGSLSTSTGSTGVNITSGGGFKVSDAGGNYIRIDPSADSWSGTGAEVILHGAGSGNSKIIADGSGNLILQNNANQVNISLIGNTVNVPKFWCGGMLEVNGNLVMNANGGNGLILPFGKKLQAIDFGFSSVSFNANGDGVINHACGQVPQSVVVTSEENGVDLIATVTAKTGTNFTIRAVNNSGTDQTSVTRSFSWIAIA